MSDSPQTHYFIYYRIKADLDVPPARARVRAMQAALAARIGVAGRLMERRDDGVTWMEIYEGITDPTAFDSALGVETAAHKLADLIEPGSARHAECFVECA